MGAFAKLSGQSATTLRAWERRYGLLEPVRSDGGHRLYTEDDLRVVRRVSELMGMGQAIGAIAKQGRSALLRAMQGREEQAPAETAPRWVGSLVAAAEQIDPLAVRQVLDDVFAHLTGVDAAERVLVPALYEIGRRWHEGTVPVAGEHLVTCELEFRLRKLIDTPLGATRGQRPVLCVNPEGELHELGLLFLALRLVAAAVPIVYFGASLPLDALRPAIRALDARAVCLSVTQQTTFEALRGSLGGFARTVKPPVFVGGLGVRRDEGLEADGVRLWCGERSLSAFVATMMAL